jgi:Homeodomain-like domain-containing protein
MRSIEEVREVLSLIEQGLNDSEICRQTGIPRGTVRDWRRGKIPLAVVAAKVGMSCPRCGHPRHDFSRLPLPAYTYLLGLYLGDGCIVRAGRVYRLRVVLDRRYPGIVAECRRAMEIVMPSSRVGVQRKGNVQADYVGSYSKAWPCLFPQHGPGRKHRRQIYLSAWQQALVDLDPRPLLRGLIHSDGSHSVNTIKHPQKTYVYPRYLFSNRSDDIKRIFCSACDSLGIEWREMNAQNISIAQRESIALMDEFIGPKT